MTNMEARRRGMLAYDPGEPPVEHWDYILLPDADGLMTRTDYITVNAGQKITIAWDATGFDGGTGRRVFRASNTNLLEGEVYPLEADLPTTIWIAVMTQKTRAQDIAFGAYSNSNSTRFKGKYLKIRIE